MRVVTFKEMKDMKLCPWSRAHLKRLEDAGQWPKRVKLGQQRVVWKLDQVLEHLSSLPQ